MKRFWLVLALAGGCGTEGGDVTGPFTGAMHRFVVDELRLPLTRNEAKAMGGDLNGDRNPDNQLGFVIAALMEVDFDTPSPHGGDMIRSGALASSVEIQADDLQEDGSVGLHYFGADGAETTVVGGRFLDGEFLPNRTFTTAHPGAARIRLPAFLEADPVELPVHGLEIELAPDAGGGYVGALHGAIRVEDAFLAVHRGMAQMVASNPGGHLTLVRFLDRNNDGEITLAELKAESFLLSLLAPDVRLAGFADELISIGFEVHLSPCAEGLCIEGPPADRCHDRVRDGDESDLDCGGSCPLPCAGSLACRVPADCQSGTCNAGSCAAPSCTDGRKDGFESDVDCGGICSGCGSGKRCTGPRDCASQSCVGGVCS